jgi:hypothetical protein
MRGSENVPGNARGGDRVVGAGARDGSNLISRRRYKDRDGRPVRCRVCKGEPPRAQLSRRLRRNMFAQPLNGTSAPGSGTATS